MTDNETFGGTLSTWLHEEAEHRVPDHLGEVLVRTAATRQRPWWSSHERWLPMDTATTFRGRIPASRPLLLLGVLLALLLAAAGAVVMTGAFRSSTATFGLATNGRILIADGTELRSYAADGTDPKVVLSLPNGAAGLAISPDGTKLAFATATEPESVQILPVSGGQPISIPLPAGTRAGDQISWSPAGDQLVFPTVAGTTEALYTARVDGSPATELGAGIIPSVGLWWPSWSPDGKTITFLTDEDGAGNGALNVIHPDGTGFQRLTTPTVAVGSSAGNVWSAEPGTQRVLYVGVGNTVRLHDFVAGTDTSLVGGFWPTWSPDGKQIAFWGDGMLVTSTDDAIHGVARQTRVFPAFHDNCQANMDLAGTVYCGPVAWSPDGTRVIAPDIAGTSVLSLLANGKGSPIVIPLGTSVLDKGNPVAWQPMRP